MRTSARLVLGVLGVVGVIVPVLSSQSGGTIDKSYAGTWKANMAKSKYEPGPGPKESTRIHEDRGGGFWLITTDTVGPQGQKGHGAYVYKPDGKQYPVAGLNQPGAATISLVYVDPYTVTFTQYADGKAIGTGKRTVSKDGKTMTIETKGTNPQGQPVSSNVVWEKQP
jgi:hypothetical protein